MTILAIASALLCSMFVPVDVYLTSQFKHSDGTWEVSEKGGLQLDGGGVE